MLTEEKLIRLRNHDWHITIRDGTRAAEQNAKQGVVLDRLGATARGGIRIPRRLCRTTTLWLSCQVCAARWRGWGYGLANGQRVSQGRD